MHADPDNAISDFRGFCELQDDWVLMTSSFDQHLPEKTALRRLNSLRASCAEERLMIAIRKAALGGVISRRFIVPWLRSRLFRMRGNHPWRHWESAMRHFERGDVLRGRECAAPALDAARRDLSLLRRINAVAPSLLCRRHGPLSPPPGNARIAIVIPGGLRCWQRNAALLEELGRYCDVFVCTSPEFAAIEHQLPTGFCWSVVEDDPALPSPAMQQWMRLDACLRMVSTAERDHGKTYTHILKLRTDYCFMDPVRLLPSVAGIGTGLAACSDKVFGGDRDTVIGIARFCANLMDYHVDGDHRFTVDLGQVERSDDSFKWFGLLLPESLLRGAAGPACLRSASPGILRKALVMPDDGAPCRRMMLTLYDLVPPGTRVFASEVCFALFLNRMGVDVLWKSPLAGVLWRDRMHAR